ncbi:MAG TPA: glycosyltransferase, partial [Phycisphaerales bacterium]|nr:glycosyltransferase [Phycisphaerales bacterium]
PEHLRVVLYPGAITVHRGLETMIDSAPYLAEAVYVVMGYARNKRYLERLKCRAQALNVLGSKVYFRNAVPIEDVVRYTASADLGIVPTQNVCMSYLFESSNKIFHCLMAGVPVAMSDHPEKRLIIEQFGVGVLFDETQPQAVAKAVNDILRDRAEYGRMHEACLRAARELNWEREELRLHALYSRLLDRTTMDAASSKHAVDIETKVVPALSVVLASGEQGSPRIAGQP